MKRRKFVRYLALAAAMSLLPRSLRAQKKMHRLAFVHSGIPADRLTESGDLSGFSGLPNEGDRDGD